MKKIFIIFILFSALFFTVVAQTEDELFGEDSLFDDMVTEIEEDTVTSQNETTLELFKPGVRFGGSVNASMDILAPFWKDGKWFSDFQNNLLLMPSLDATLFFDARPIENLRMYGKFGLSLPFSFSLGLPNPNPPPKELPLQLTLFEVKELFTDFSWNDRVFFRFGKHTVKWGVGYFFSPADIINKGKIDPEKPTEQIDGSLNLRTQIVFPGKQTNLYFYIIPSMPVDLKITLPAFPSSTQSQSTSNMRFIDTAVASKVEFLVGNFELGSGVYFQYEKPLRICFTASGSIAGKVGVFGELVGIIPWKSEDYKNFGSVFQGTVGFSKSFSKQNISIAGQYLFDSGHAIAASFSKSKLGSDKLSLTVFGQVKYNDISFENATWDKLSSLAKVNLSYKCFSFLTLSSGPYWSNVGSQQDFGLNISAKLGGGKF